jgi:N-acetyl-gamma-glutamyl-phosphate/LysW-gamma-L-alpha-aminoadipyl-6-phosphate reductase
MRAAVIGASGFVGGEILRLLHGHPAFDEVIAVSRSHAGRPIQEAHPSLAGLEGAFASLSPGGAASGRDVVYVCLEHGEASGIMDEIVAAKPGIVCDLSADFRVRDRRLHARHYGATRSAASDRFVYALADVLGRELRGETALATPGCFATAAQLALWPLARLDVAGPPVLFAVTGSSGAGAKLKDTTHHPLRAHDLFGYATLGHRHEAEIEEQWRRWTARDDAPRLAAHAGPFVRGIYLTLHARSARAAEASAVYREAYAGRRFVRVVDAPPHLARVVGTNRADLHVASDAATGEVQVSVAIDNLIKGAAGQAIQAVNLAAGLDEGAGLPLVGAYPC